jgi:hypothetical protein
MQAAVTKARRTTPPPPAQQPEFRSVFQPRPEQVWSVMSLGLGARASWQREGIVLKPTGIDLLAGR